MSNGAQLPLFSPTAEVYAGANMLDSSRPAGRAKQTTRTSSPVWQPISLSDIRPEEIEVAPSTFKELCNATSIREAVELCEKFGGLKLRIPPPEEGGRWKKSHFRLQLREILSPDSYRRLLESMGSTGCEITFPSLAKLKKRRRDQRIREVVDTLIAEKKPYLQTLHAIARAEQLHMTTIYKILKQSD